jgi:hypothetical protein
MVLRYTRSVKFEESLKLYNETGRLGGSSNRLSD